MNIIVPPKRKLIELALLPAFCVPALLLADNFDFAILMSLGYVWNWAASSDLSSIQHNRKYRMSLINLVSRIQNWVLRPFHSMHPIVSHVVSIFPAGLFWLAVLFINDSIMPWWATFVGSFLFELTQIRFVFTKTKVEKEPEPPVLPELPKDEE